MLKRYKLLKDLPTFKAGDEFFIGESGNLIAGTPEKPKTVRVGEIEPIEINLMAYAKETLEQFPNILTDWFEEIKEPKRIYYANDFGCNVANMTENNNSIIIKSLKSVGNHFETYEEAKAYLEYLKAKAIIKQDTKGFKPDWKTQVRKRFLVIIISWIRSCVILMLVRIWKVNYILRPKKTLKRALKNIQRNGEHI